MSPQRPARFLVAALACLLAACGGDDDGGTPVTAEPAVPLSWTSGQALGVLVVDEDRRSLTDLTMQTCGLDGAFVRAASSGGRVRGAADGSCRVVSSDGSVRADAATLTPVCAGALTWELVGSQSIMSCGDTLPDRFELSCVMLRDLTGVTVSSMPGELEGDEIGSFRMSAQRPSAITITEPQAPGIGLGVWPASGDLTVRWAAGEGDGVEVTLGSQDGSGDVIECEGLDDGEQTVPESLIGTRRMMQFWLRVARVKQTHSSVFGFDTTMSYRRSDTVYLNPP